MGRLGNPEWWWEYALDGILSGIVGGLVTAVAVWVTLRHGQRQAKVQALEVAVAELVSSAFRMRALFGAAQSYNDQLEIAIQFVGPAALAKARARPLDHRLYDLLEELSDEWEAALKDSPGVDERLLPEHAVTLTGVAFEFGHAASRWLADPRSTELESLASLRASMGRESAR